MACSLVPIVSSWTALSNSLFKSFFIVIPLKFTPTFPPLPSSAHPTPGSCGQSPHGCPCPWVMHTWCLTSPFPFFPPLSPSPQPLSVCAVFLCFWFYFLNYNFGVPPPKSSANEEHYLDRCPWTEIYASSYCRNVRHHGEPWTQRVHPRINPVSQCQQRLALDRERNTQLT